MGLKAAIVFVSLIWSTALWAQSWVQIEAQPSAAEAQARADAYATRIDGINVFRMRSGWYAIAIGPFDQAQAVATRWNSCCNTVCDCHSANSFVVY